MQTKGDIEIRRAGDRGSFENYWLNSRFSFSFADYYDQAHVSFGSRSPSPTSSSHASRSGRCVS